MYRVYFSILFLLVGCATQRKPIRVGEIPTMPTVTKKDFTTGSSALSELAKQYSIANDGYYYNRVENIVKKLSNAIPNGLGAKWNIYILDDDKTANAAATQGNFIFVWMGMFDEVENDDQLATILSHELGHILAGHVLPTTQDIINQQVSGIASTAAQIAARTTGLAQAGGIIGSLVGESYNAVFVYPESKRLELEADQIGLFLMAKAGYDPKEAIKFWRKFSKKSSNGINFLSTHPASDLRTKELEKLLPIVYSKYSNY